MATEQEEAHNLVSFLTRLTSPSTTHSLTLRSSLPASRVRVGVERGGTRGAEAAAHDPHGVLPTLPDAPARQRRNGKEGGQVRADGAAGSAQVRRHSHRGRDHPRRHHIQGAAATAPATSATNFDQPGLAVETAAGARRR